MADLGSSIASLMQIPGLQELVNNGITQQRQNMPLRTAINQQASNMLPNSAFGRPNMAAIPAANYSTPAPSGGTDWSKILGLLAAGGGGFALSQLLNRGAGGSGGGGSLNGIAQAIAHLFHRSSGNGAGNGPLGDFGGGGAGDQGPNTYGGFGGGGAGDQGPVYPWPETSTPFSPFDPSQVPGGSGLPSSGQQGGGTSNWWDEGVG